MISGWESSSTTWSSVERKYSIGQVISGSEDDQVRPGAHHRGAALSGVRV